MWGSLAGAASIAGVIVGGVLKDDKMKNVEAAAQKMFAALQKTQPYRVRYASCRLTDGVTFVALLELEQEDTTNPLVPVPEFVEVHEGLKTG